MGLRDEAVVEHALNDVELARSCALGVVDGVVGRWGFGQACEHRGFGHADGLQGFAEISFTGGGKAVSAVAQKNLIEINLKNLVFGQQVFELEGQQQLVNFAGKSFL